MHCNMATLLGLQHVSPYCRCQNMKPFCMCMSGKELQEYFTTALAQQVAGYASLQSQLRIHSPQEEHQAQLANAMRSDSSA